MKSFSIHTLGCKVNRYDSGKLAGILLSYGLEQRKADADLAIVNSCSVTKTAIHKDKRAVMKIRRDNPGAFVVLMGCWPQAYGIEACDAAADLVWGVGKLNELAVRILKSAHHGNIESENAGSIIKVAQDRSRYFIKVQEGCEQYCSYCVIPYARGKLYSRPECEVINEVKAATDEGYAEIILSGTHLGLYGKEKGSKAQTDLLGLLERIAAINNLSRIRLSSIEVIDINEDLIEFIASEKKMCKHLHIPLQSGADRILKSMNRPYTTAYFRDKVKAIREKIPDIAISTDVIVGFPGEDESGFYECAEFIKAIGFSRLHVFPFSAHEKTPAYAMPGKVPEKIIKERAGVLREIGEALEADFKNKFEGSELEVVLERINNDGTYLGKSEYYFDVIFNDGEILGDAPKAITKGFKGRVFKVRTRKIK